MRPKPPGAREIEIHAAVRDRTLFDCRLTTDEAAIAAEILHDFWNQTIRHAPILANKMPCHPTDIQLLETVHEHTDPPLLDSLAKTIALKIAYPENR